MAYRFKANESLEDGVKRVVREEIESACGLLGKADGGQRDEAIHEARKSVKKIRGILRLVKPELGRSFRKENATFQELGQHLSDLRDAAALIEVFEQIAAKSKEKLPKKTVDAIRSGLKKEKIAVEKRLAADEVIKDATEKFSSLGKNTESWSFTHKSFRAIAVGLEATYRQGRKALKKAEQAQEAVAYHNLRKRVKDHWYHVRLLENLWTDIIQAHESSLKELETWLGDDHNLVLLTEKLRKKPANFGGKPAVEAFLKTASQHQKQLRENATLVAHRVYAEKPRAFVENVNQLWDVWQKTGTEPKPVAQRPAAKQKKNVA